MDMKHAILNKLNGFPLPDLFSPVIVRLVRNPNPEPGESSFLVVERLDKRLDETPRIKRLTDKYLADGWAVMWHHDDFNHLMVYRANPAEENYPMKGARTLDELYGMVDGAIAIHEETARDLAERQKKKEEQDMKKVQAISELGPLAEEYARGLKDADWFYLYSNEPETLTKGDFEFERLAKLREQLPEEIAEQIDELFPPPELPK